jgi:general secretion pathway protein K
MSFSLISANEEQEKGLPLSGGQTGIAMILAIMAVFLLSVAVLQTRAGVDLAEEIAISSAQEIQAFYLARSGLALVREALADDDPEVDSYNDDWAAANDLGAIPIADVGWAIGKVEDEEGKFNVLDLVNQDGESDENTDMAALRLEDLLQILGLEESRAVEIVDSLIDWMDFDNSVTGSGAEEPYYSSLVPSYTCANEHPTSVDDLALIKGIGPVLLREGEGDVPPLLDYITVHGKKKAGDKFRRININTAPLQVIAALSPEIDLELAEEIVAYRDGEPFNSAAEVKDVPGFPGEEFFSNELAFLIDTSSDHFSARVTGETSSASSRAYGVFSRQGKTVSLVYYKGF